MLNFGAQIYSDYYEYIMVLFQYMKWNWGSFERWLQIGPMEYDGNQKTKKLRCKKKRQGYHDLLQPLVKKIAHEFPREYQFCVISIKFHF